MKKDFFLRRGGSLLASSLQVTRHKESAWVSWLVHNIFLMYLSCLCACVINECVLPQDNVYL